MRRFLIAAAVLCLSLPVFGGKYNPTLSIGDEAPKWTDLESTSGEAVSLGDLKNVDVLVLVFTCNTCPYAVDYEDRLIDFAKGFSGRSVALIAVNSNAGDKDSLKAMKERSTSKAFPFSYLKDESGQVGKAYGALRTPEFVVLNRDRKVVYLGAMDDDPQGRKVTERYVEQAVEAALNESIPEVAETPPIGCAIKYPRERRSAPR